METDGLSCPLRFITKKVIKMSRLTIHTVETAPEAAKPRIEAVLKNNGFIPNLIGVFGQCA